MTTWMSRWGLRFDDPQLERQFVHEYCESLAPRIQIAFILGAVIFYAFLGWDRIIDPVNSGTTHAIRAALAALVLGTAPLLFTRWGLRHLEVIQTTVVTLSALALTLIYTVLERGFDFGAVGIVLVTLFNVVMLRSRLPYVAGFLAVAWGAFIGAQIITSTDGHAMVYVNLLVAMCSIVFGVLSTFNQERDARVQFVLERELTASKQQVEELIHSMLPAQIVARMKSGERNIADSYGEVSIVFADLVGFTQLSRKVAPHHLVEILNKLFSSFDELANSHGVEKIKTIGDAYMAVSGMTKGDSRHAEHAAEFALAMLASVESLSRELGFPLNIRIGLHVGPIIAGVIGTRKPAFDCWGDSVNIASRLESSGTSGGIQISETARWRLQHRYNVVENEDVDIKGIGRTKTYTLLAR